MAVDFDKMLPRVFVGSCPISAGDVQFLHEKVGVTAVLNLQTEEDFAYWGIDWDSLEKVYCETGVEVRRVPVPDFDPDALRRCLPRGVDALDALLRAGHAVYVHCSAGVNRSPSTVVAYLHWMSGWAFDDAVQHVVSHRDCDPYVEAIRLATEDRAKDSPR